MRPGETSEAKLLRVPRRERRPAVAAAPARGQRARDGGVRGAGAEPCPPRQRPAPPHAPLPPASGPGCHAPSPRAEPSGDTVRPLSECRLGGWVPPTCVCPVPPGRSRRGRATQRRLEARAATVDRAPERPDPGPGAPARAGTGKGAPHTPPAPQLRGSALPHSQAPASQPEAHSSFRGGGSPLTLHPPHAYKRGARASTVQAIPGTGTAAAGRSCRRRRRPLRTPGAPPAGPPAAARYLRPARRLALFPRVAPARRRRCRRGSTAFCVPPGVGRDRTERQTRQSNRHRFYLAPPTQSSTAPIGGTLGGRPSNHRARRARRRRASPTQSALRARGRAVVARARAGGGGARLKRRDWPCGSAAAVSLFFR